MTTNKMQISGHSMGQELELPRRKILTEITQDDARNDDYRRSSSQRSSHRTEQTKDMPIQNQRRTFSPQQNEGKQSKPTPRQPSSAHLAPALSVQISPPGVSCQHDGNIIY